MSKQIKWYKSDIAYHKTYGLVEIFKVSSFSGFADVMPLNEKKVWCSMAISKIRGFK